MARAEAPWLGAVQIKADGSVDGFSETASTQDTDVVMSGGTALLAQLLGLLITFIGETLTLRLVRDIWPDVSLNDMNPGTEEILS